MAVAPFPVPSFMRHLAGLLAVLALAFHALMPSGYMVSANDAGNGVEITLCTQDGNVAAFMAPDGTISHSATTGDNTDPNQSDPSSALCDFALHGNAIAVSAPKKLAGAQHFPVPETLNPPSIWPALGQALAAPPPPKTGPPHQA
jgi:hypothetical protein